MKITVNNNVRGDVNFKWNLSELCPIAFVLCSLRMSNDTCLAFVPHYF